jgi:hypothetical protein
MSNIYYYINFVLGKQYHSSVKHDIYVMLMKKFGKVLPYHPDPNFKQEREYLTQLGYLRKNNDIVINGTKVGSYV